MSFSMRNAAAVALIAGQEPKAAGATHRCFREIHDRHMVASNGGVHGRYMTATPDCRWMVRYLHEHCRLPCFSPVQRGRVAEATPGSFCSDDRTWKGCRPTAWKGFQLMVDYATAPAIMLWQRGAATSKPRTMTPTRVGDAASAVPTPPSLDPLTGGWAEARRCPAARNCVAWTAVGGLHGPSMGTARSVLLLDSQREMQALGMRQGGTTRPSDSNFTASSAHISWVTSTSWVAWPTNTLGSACHTALQTEGGARGLSSAGGAQLRRVYDTEPAGTHGT